MRRMIGRWIILLGLLGALWCPAVFAVDFMNDVKPPSADWAATALPVTARPKGRTDSSCPCSAPILVGIIIPSSEARGRRIMQAAPEASLFLRKATGEVGHGGGYVCKGLARISRAA